MVGIVVYTMPKCFPSKGWWSATRPSDGSEDLEGVGELVLYYCSHSVLCDFEGGGFFG